MCSLLGTAFVVSVYVQLIECILLLRQQQKLLQKISTVNKENELLQPENFSVQLTVQNVETAFASQIWLTSSLHGRLILP